MKLIIDDKLKSKKKTRYWLSKEIGYTYKTIKKLCDNETTSIKFDLLDKICDVLDCEPGDIIKR